MKLVFVDETENTNLLGTFYGVCAVAIDAANYSRLRTTVESALREVGWRTEYEFKGTCLFSQKTGDERVTIENRIDAAAGIIAGTMGERNSRCHSAFAWNTCGNTQSNHVQLVGAAVRAALPKAVNGRRDKNLAACFADEKHSIPADALSAAVRRAASERGYMVLEDVVQVRSSCSRPGLLVTDLVAYLCMWTYAGHLSRERQMSFLDPTLESLPRHADKKLATTQYVLDQGSGVMFVPKFTN